MKTVFIRIFESKAHAAAALEVPTPTLVINRGIYGFLGYTTVTVSPNQATPPEVVRNAVARLASRHIDGTALSLEALPVNFALSYNHKPCGFAQSIAGAERFLFS
jgi:hypothetical protein